MSTGARWASSDFNRCHRETEVDIDGKASAFVHVHYKVVLHTENDDRGTDVIDDVKLFQ